MTVERRPASFADDGGLVRALAPFAPLQVTQLERFLEVARRLTNESPLFAPGEKVGVEIWSDGVKSIAPVDRLQTAGLLTDFRQLYGPNEECSYSKLSALLGKHSLDSEEGETLRVWLKELNRVHKECLIHGAGFPWTMPGEQMNFATTAALLDDWLNGDVFHSDPAHGARHRAAAEDASHRTALLTSVQALMGVYVSLARVIKLIVAEPVLRVP